MRAVTIILEAMHDESSDTHLAALLAKFTSDLHNTGYTVTDVVCMDAEYVPPTEEPKTLEQMTPIPPEVAEHEHGASEYAVAAEEALDAEEEQEPEPDEEEAGTSEESKEEESVDESESMDEDEEGSEEGTAPPEKPKSKPLIDPGDYTVADLRDGLLDGYIRRQLNSLHAREMKGKARDGAVAAIKDAIDALGGH